MTKEKFYEIQDFYLKTEGEWPDALEIKEVYKNYSNHKTERAISGFEDFDKAREFALKHNLETVILSRAFGQDYWRFENFANGPIELDYEWFDDDDKLYSILDGSILEDDIEQVILDEQMPTIEAENYRDEFKDIFDAIDELKEDEQVLIRHFEPGNFEIISKTTMSIDKDSTSYIIAVM